MRTFCRFRLSCIVAMLLFAACHDDTDEILLPDLILSETEIEIGALGRYYTVKVSGLTDGDSIASVSPSDEWVSVEGIYSSALTIYVKPNDTQRHRYATVYVMSAEGRKASFAISQRSEAEDDNNALDSGSLELKSRVGWGYDLTQDYMDVASATELVFDYEGLLRAEKEYGAIVAQDKRNHIDYTMHTAYSIAEMAEHLMKEQTDAVEFLGLGKKLTKYKMIDNFEQSQQSYGFAKITKTVATRYIDVGKVEAIIREGRTDIFTNDFAEYYKAVLDNPTKESAERLVTKFGTHVVTYADLGGRLEYTVNFSAVQVNRDEMERVMKYKNGKLKEKDEERRKKEFSTLNSTMTATVHGGSDSTRYALQTATVSDDANQQIPAALLSAWANTITDKQQQNLAMSNCRLTPIWQLFTNEEARNSVLSYIIRMVDNMMLSAEMRELLGISGYYKFAVEDLKPEDFGTDANATLVKVAYVNKVPILEICNEYVPEIRGDRRVTIVYPITSQSSNIRRGVFLGNSDHAPCEVSFDDKGGCYVANMEGYQVGDVIDTLYYVDGALYTADMNTPVQDAKGKTQVQVQHYVVGKNSYPLVKIGPGYWSRRNAYGAADGYNHKGEPEGEVSMQGINYTKYDNWSMPTLSDLEALTNYIGNNQKALFKGQQTGYEASFDGRCRVYSPYNRDWDYYEYTEYSLLEKNERCYNIFKKHTSTSRKVMELSSNYTYKIADVTYTGGGWYDIKDYYYPYRPFHNSEHKYSDLK